MIVTVEYSFDPIDVVGTGMWSNTQRPAAYTATGVVAHIDSSGRIGITYRGSKAGRPLRDGFWSDDVALEVHRVKATLMASRARQAAEVAR